VVGGTFLILFINTILDTNMDTFKRPTKLKTQIAIVDDGEITLEQCIAVANAHGWWHFGHEKKTTGKSLRGGRWLFIKVTNVKAITQDQFTVLKSPVCYPPKVFFKATLQTH
jgi:hypothetical protein